MEFFDSLKDKDGVVKICAPMVRYSKLPFRLLVREYGCDLAFSPMIMAESFSVSEKVYKLLIYKVLLFQSEIVLIHQD